MNYTETVFGWIYWSVIAYVALIVVSWLFYAIIFVYTTIRDAHGSEDQDGEATVPPRLQHRDGT